MSRTLRRFYKVSYRDSLIFAEKGQKYCHQTCNEKVKDILENYQPEALPDDVLRQLEEIAQGATNPETLSVSKTKKAKRRRKFRAV